MVLKGLMLSISLYIVNVNAYTFVYGDNNRLKDIKVGDEVIATYIYNAKGQRARKITEEGTTDYYYNLNGYLITETTDHVTYNEYIYLNGRPVAYFVNNTHYKVLTNRLGAPVALLDSTDTIVWGATYTPYGQATVYEDPDGDGQTVTMNLRLPGQYYDKETGLHYNRFRYYDPAIGRYLRSDPIGLDGGMNTYVYANGNPVINIDRLALETTVITVRDAGFGTHSAVHVDNGTSGSPTLYDPSGGYIPKNGEPRGSGDIFEGEDADLEDYKRYHEQNGSTIETAVLPTTPAQEKEIAERAEYLGGSPLGGLCTLMSSSALGGVCGIGKYLLPSGLAEDAANAQCK